MAQKLSTSRDPDPLVALAVPDPDPVAPPGLADVSNMLLGWLKWGALIGGVAGLLICSIMIIVGRRNRNALAADGMQGSVWVLGGLAMASTAAAIVGVFTL